MGMFEILILRVQGRKHWIIQNSMRIINTGSNPVLTTKNKNKMEKIVSIKILRPITLPIIGMFLITYIIVAYVFDLEM